LDPAASAFFAGLASGAAASPLSVLKIPTVSVRTDVYITPCRLRPLPEPVIARWMTGSPDIEEIRAGDAVARGDYGRA
jgi:hypothetical protein